MLRRQGQLKTLSIRTDITIVPNARKANDASADYRAYSGDVEIGAARTGVRNLGQRLPVAQPGSARVRVMTALRQSLRTPLVTSATIGL